MLKSGRQLGFTVVEVLIAIGLFGVIAPSIVLAVVSIGQINDKAADLTQANVIAENKIETIRSAGFNSLTDGTVSFTGELPATFTAPKNAQYVVTTPVTGQKKIEITIVYTDHGKTRTLKYASLISELGVAQ